MYTMQYPKQNISKLNLTVYKEDNKEKVRLP